jgi:CheY-like chemotaxis protein
MPPKSSPRRLLIVDDEKIVLDAASLMLQHLGHEVVTAINSQEALNCFSRQNFDLVFTDYSMPGMRGDELANAMKRLRPGQPIVMITAYAEVLSPLPDVDMVICKPFLLQHLRDAIERFAPAATSPPEPGQQRP